MTTGRGGRHRRAVFAGLAAFLVLAGLEGALRLAGWVVLAGWRDAPGPGEGTVACVGDSFTFGLGAPDASFSYPSLLQGILDARRPGLGARIENHGVPGATSFDAEATLRELLRRPAPPRTVLWLAGLNDGGDLAALGPVMDLGAGAPDRVRSLGTSLDRLRTYRLVRWSLGATGVLRGARLPVDPAPVAAGWSALGWQDDARALAAFRASEAAHGASFWTDLGLGLALARRGAYADALPRLDRARAAAPDVSWRSEADFQRAQCFRRLGRRGEALAALDAASPEDGRGEAIDLLRAWIRVDGAGPEPSPPLTPAEISSGIPTDLHGAYAQDARAWLALAAGRAAEAEAAFRAVDAAPFFLRGGLGRALSLAALGRCGEAGAAVEARKLADARAAPWFEAVLAVCDAAREDRDSAVARLARARSVAPRPADLDPLARALAEPGPLPARDGVLDVLALGFPPLPPYDLDLVHHDVGPTGAWRRATTLRYATLAAAARGEGVRLVAMTYPAPDPAVRRFVNDGIRAAARSAGLPLVDHEGWSLAAPPSERDSLFVPDGVPHPSAEGYRRMAERIWEAEASLHWRSR